MAVYYDNTPKVSLAEASPLAFCIETVQNEQKFFEAVIEADFLEVYAEHGLISFNEGDVNPEDVSKETAKATGNKVTEIIKNAIERFVGFFKGLWSKIVDIITKDSKRDTFLKAIEAGDISGYKPNYVIAYENIASALQELSNNLAAYIKNADSDDFDIKKIAEDLKISEFGFKKYDGEANSEEASKSKRAIIDFFRINGPESFNKHSKVMEKEEIDKIKASSNKSDSAKENVNEFSNVSKAIKNISKLNAVYGKACGSMTRIARGEFNKMAAYAIKSKGSQGENAQDAETESYIDLSNDYYMSEAFSFV